MKTQFLDNFMPINGPHLVFCCYQRSILMQFTVPVNSLFSYNHTLQPYILRKTNFICVEINFLEC